MKTAKVMAGSFDRSLFNRVARGSCFFAFACACAGTPAMPVETNYANGTRPTEENAANGTRPVAPVTPDVETYAGVFDRTFSSAQQKPGALYASNGEVVGVMLVKAGKVSGKGYTTLNAKATFLNGKSISAKTKVQVNGNGSDGALPQCEFAFKAPVGTMLLNVGSDGKFTLSNSGYSMRAATVGGNLGSGGTKATFSLSGAVEENYANGTRPTEGNAANGTRPTEENAANGTRPVAPVAPVASDVHASDINELVPGDVIREYLPNNFTFDVSDGKWKFARAGTVKLVTNKETGAYELSANGENISGLKLTYTARTGGFKGSFKAYSLETVAGKTRLKKTSVSVAGFVIDGVGHGQASVRSSSGTTLAVTIR